MLPGKLFSFFRSPGTGSRICFDEGRVTVRFSCAYEIATTMKIAATIGTKRARMR